MSFIQSILAVVWFGIWVASGFYMITSFLSRDYVTSIILAWIHGGGFIGFFNLLWSYVGER